MTRAKPKDVFGTYGCVPRRWHARYGRVSFYARSIAVGILAEVDDFSDLSIATDGEWQTSICRTLRISGPERRNAKSAMTALLKAGLIRVEPGRVRVLLVPDEAADELPDAQPERPVPRSVPCPVPSSVPVSVPSPVLDSDLSQVPENTQNTSRQKAVIKQHLNARAEDGGACEVQTPASERRRLWSIGYRWFDEMLGGGGRASQHRKWERDYELFGAKNPAERSQVARNVLATGYVQADRWKATPEHVAAYWEQFAAGPRNFRSEPKPPVKTARPMNGYDRDAARAAEVMVTDPERPYMCIPLRELKARQAAAGVANA